MEGDNVTERNVWEMYEAGWSIEEISSVLGMPVDEVENIIRG